MNILLVNSGTLDRNGICMFTYRWAHSLMSSFPDNSITVYFKLNIVDRALQKAFKADGIKVIAGNHTLGGTFSDKNNLHGIRNDVRSILRNEKYDVVHIHSSVIGFTSLILSEAVRARVPVRIAHAHGEFEENRIQKLIHDLLRRYIRKKSTIYAGCSRQSGVYLFGNKGVSSKKWYMVPNGIDTVRFAYDKEARSLYRREIGIADNVLLLGAVGYLIEIKNHAFLIDVMAELKTRNIPVKLIILGAGLLKDELLAKTKSLDLEDSIILYGKTDDVAGWLSAMDMYLMPSLTEGLPISAVEAQASGLPCILSDRISDEVDILPSLCHLPIDKGADIWADRIEKMYMTGVNDEICVTERINATQLIVEARFDLTALADEIGKMYGLYSTR